MKKQSLDLVVTLQSSEATLRKVQSKLAGEDSQRAALCGALEQAIQQTLADAGIEDSLEIEFHCGQIKGRYDTGGGLNASEWLEAKKSS